MTVAAAPTEQQNRERRERDALLLLLLLVTDADVAASVVLWRRFAPPAYAGLLGAVAISNVRTFTDQRPPVWFDVYSQRYGLGSRGFIQTPALLAALEQFRDAAKVQAASDVVTAYTDTPNAVEHWQTTLAQQLKGIALAVVALAVGGIARVTAAERASAGDALRFHFDRLARFGQQIAEGQIERERAATRAAQYPDSVITGTYDDARRRSAIAAGMTEEQNILDEDAEHCQRNSHSPPGIPDCPSLTDLGWVSIGQMPPPGARLCKWNCRCHFDFRRTP